MVRSYRSSRKGFTLIEILIVVIILGILAAIVIPQFSSASNDARRSNVQTTAQTLRSQIALFRLQHADKLPDVANFWDLMTLYSSEDYATLSTAKTATTKYGPYMQQVAPNALNQLTNVVDGTSGSNCGYVYDYAAGVGSGQIWGTDTDKATLVKP